MRKSTKDSQPNKSFIVYLSATETREGASAPEVLKHVLTALGLSKKTSHISEEDAVRALYLLCKEGFIFRFKLPWNLRFDVRSGVLIRKDYEGQTKVKEKTGGLSQKSALALLPSVVNNHTEKLDKLENLSIKLTALLEQQVETNKLTKSRIDSLESRFDSLESRLSKIEAKASKPSKKDSSPKVEAKASKKNPESEAIASILSKFNLA